MASIQKRLLRALIIGMAVIASATGATIYYHVHEEMDELYNSHLKHIATLLAKQLARPPLHDASATTDTRQAILNWEEEDYLIQIWDRAGHLINEQGPATETAIPLQSETGIVQVEISGTSWLIFRADADSISIQIAQPESARKDAIAETSLTLWLPLALQIPLIMLLGWFSVRHSLQPLNALSHDISKRQPATLSPLEVTEQPPELHPLIHTLNDLLRRLEVALQKQRDFIADAAHELRTPVAALQLQLDLLRRAKEQADRELAIDQLERGLRRATRLIQQMLSIARAESSLIGAPKLIDLQVAGELALKRHLTQASFRDIDMGVLRFESVAVVGTDVDIDILFDNLLSNAIKYTPPGGKVDVSVFENQNSAILEVADSGLGIDPRETERIFDRFYRVLQDPATTDGPEGSGLGLSIVKAICERYDITLDVTDGADGIGTVFTLRWPSHQTF